MIRRRVDSERRRRRPIKAQIALDAFQSVSQLAYLLSKLSDQRRLRIFVDFRLVYDLFGSLREQQRIDCVMIAAAGRTYVYEWIVYLLLLEIQFFE